MIYITYAYEPEIKGLTQLTAQSGMACRYVRARGNRAGDTLTAALDTLPAGPKRGLEPFFILNVGFAGALNPTLHTGDLVLVDRFTSHTVSAMDGPPISVPLRIGTYCEQQNYARVTCLTVDKAIETETEKRAQRRNTGTDIVDMEGVHLSESARRRNCPFASLKVISDEADGSTYDTAVGQADKWSKILVPATYALLAQLGEINGGMRGNRWKLPS